MRLPGLRLAIAALLVISAACRSAATASCAAENAASPAVSAESRVAAAAIRLPAGYTVTPVASEPQLANPVAFCFDPQGRIYVAETFRVNHGVEDNRHHMDWLDDDLAARTVDQRRDYMARRKGDEISDYTQRSDQVRLLEDRDRDGLYEHSTMFSTGYNDVADGAAAGVLWIDGRLLFTCIPSLWELRDNDGDGVADHKRSLADGFGVHVAFYGHDMHGLTHGPDGKVYFSIGDRGLHVTLPDGRTLSNPDSGAVLRCNPDGSELELFATGLRNPQELAFNEFGDLFTVDNNSDSGDRARLVHIVEGMDAGWRMSYQYLPDRGPFNREKIWHVQNAEQPPAIVPPLAHITDGPSGLVRYPGTGLPAEHAGAFFIVDFRGTPVLSGIREFWVERQGATYRLVREQMFAEGVLATDCDFGSDSALYVSDWIEGWEGTGQGRIHRIASEDASANAQGGATAKLLTQIEKLGVDELAQQLAHPDTRVRMAAQMRLVALQSDAALLAVATSQDAQQIARIHAIWGLGALGEDDPAILSKLSDLCSDPDAEVRTQAARALGRGRSHDSTVRQVLGEKLLPLCSDPLPRVRSAAAISLGNLKCAAALDALKKLAAESAMDDATLRHAAALGLAESQTPESLLKATEGREAQRLALAVALGRQRSPLIAKLLADESERVRLAAARSIWDAPIAEGYDALAAALKGVDPANEPMLRRAMAASVATRNPAHLQALITGALRSDLTPEMRGHAWQLIREWASPSPRDPVHGSWRPLEQRPAETLATALRSALPSIKEAGVHGMLGLIVAAEAGVEEARSGLAAVIATEDHPVDFRRRALAALAGADEQLVAPAIDAGIKSVVPEVRSAARQLMIERFPERAVEQLREAAESATTGERQAALAMLAGIKVDAARTLIATWLDRLEQGTCPPELQLDVLDAAVQSGDSALVSRHQAYLQRLSSGDPLAAFSMSLEGGDAESGRRIFTEDTALACRRCHSATPGEILVGPNLSDVGARLSRGELLEAIVKPNAKIAEGFQTTVLQLDSGQVVAGILRSENEQQLTLIDPDNKEIVVDAATIEGRLEGLSAMPEDLVKRLTPRSVRDLIEFLSQQRVATAADDASVHGLSSER